MTAEVTMNSERKKKRIRLIPDFHEFFVGVSEQRDQSAPICSARQNRSKSAKESAKKIVARLPDHETLTLSQIVKLTKGKPSTVKLRLKELVEIGYLVPKGQRRGALCTEVKVADWLAVKLTFSLPQCVANHCDSKGDFVILRVCLWLNLG